jgi:GNAT superfamily N-acetyltransferase
MSLKVRRATRDDADAIAEFAMQLVQQHLDYDPVRFASLGDLAGMRRFYGDQTEADEAAVLVADVDGRVAGFAYVAYERRNYAELSECSARLHDIFVAGDARHTGAGAALIKAAADAAREFGAEKMTLSVAVQNTAAQNFFDRSGFRTTMLEKMLVLK